MNKRGLLVVVITIVTGFFFLAAPSVKSVRAESGETINKTESGKIDPAAFIKRAVNQYRGEASISTVEMIIHRPDWERRLTMEAWTRGEKDSLIKIVATAKDRNNGTLKRGIDMWTFNPKINRVIKLPPSMMARSWMGSDFSNNDIAKSDTLITDYTYVLLGSTVNEGKAVHRIKAMPLPDAPVVWGMIVVDIREDFIILKEEFFDEDMELVKTLSMHNIQMMDDRLFPVTWRVEKADAVDEYTELIHLSIDFTDTIADSFFTKAGLKKPLR